MPERVAIGMLAVVLLIAAIVDWRTHKVPNWLTLPAMIIGVVYWTAWGLTNDGLNGGLVAAGRSLLCLLVVIVPMLVIYHFGAFGGGDVKLLAAAAAITANLVFMIYLALYAICSAALIAVVMMIALGRVKQTFAVIFSAAASKLAGSKQTLPNDVKMPFAVAILLGACMAAYEVTLGLNFPWSAWTR